MEIAVGLFSLLSGRLLKSFVLVAAGANLVGSDLYSKLSEYFVSHFKPMKEVVIFVLSLVATADFLGYRKQRRFKTRTSCDIMLLNGTATRRERIT